VCVCVCSCACVWCVCLCVCACASSPEVAGVAGSWKTQVCERTYTLHQLPDGPHHALFQRWSTVPHRSCTLCPTISCLPHQPHHRHAEEAGKATLEAVRQSLPGVCLRVCVCARMCVGVGVGVHKCVCVRVHVW